MRKPNTQWRDLITHEDTRQHFQFIWIFLIMAFISAFMTVMNYITGWREALMVATLTFSLLNIINAALEYLGNNTVQKIPRVLFAVEIIALFTFFVINGQPKGFSTLWAALLPTCGLLLYRGVVGSLISGIQFAILVFLFYFPAGQQLLNFEYTDVFMMRFPVLYAAFFIVGLFFELVRHYTQQELKAARDRYKDENFRIMQVLADEYGVVVSVNMEDGSMDFYSGKQFKPTTPENKSFFEYMEMFADGMVTSESRNHFKEFFAKDNIRKTLRCDSSAILTFASDVSGAERYFQARVVGVPEKNGDVKQFVVAFSDADTFVREQQRIQQELRTQRAKAESASKAKTDFLFNMSHDIRTPMNAIIGFTNMAIKEADDPVKVCESLRKVSLSGNMLLSLINDILDMSRIESGKVNITATPTDVETIFDDIRSVMANLAASKDIELTFDISSIHDRYVYADKPRIDRILVNLVSNAVKYTEGYGRVKVRCEQVAGGTMNGSRLYRFSVQDNGIGMSEEFQRQMFEEFAREENSTVRGVQGTGLGLPLAKKLTEIMGGTITCESQQGVGSTFIVTLPLKLQENAPSEEESAEARRIANIDVSGRRVLLVEDNELNREIATYLLEEKGMTVECAVDGREAVTRLSENGPDRYDFVLMDIQMPIMNGYEASEKIRAMYPDSRLPIIALSANAFEEDRHRSLAAGMNDHVSKPIDMNELLKSLSKFI